MIKTETPLQYPEISDEQIEEIFTTSPHIREMVRTSTLENSPHFGEYPSITALLPSKESYEYDMIQAVRDELQKQGMPILALILQEKGPEYIRYLESIIRNLPDTRISLTGYIPTAQIVNALELVRKNKNHPIQDRVQIDQLIVDINSISHEQRKRGNVENIAVATVLIDVDMQIRKYRKEWLMTQALPVFHRMQSYERSKDQSKVYTLGKRIHERFSKFFSN